MYLPTKSVYGRYLSCQLVYHVAVAAIIFALPGVEITEARHASLRDLNMSQPVMKGPRRLRKEMGRAKPGRADIPATVQLELDGFHSADDG
jgi:hypothetical protein